MMKIDCASQHQSGFAPESKRLVVSFSPCKAAPVKIKHTPLTLRQGTESENVTANRREWGMKTIVITYGLLENSSPFALFRTY